MTWRETVNDTTNVLPGDTQTFEYGFLGIYPQSGGVGPNAPASSDAAIAAAVADGANLRVDGVFKAPTGLTTFNDYILASMKVTRVAGTSAQSDIAWLFTCTLELAGQRSTAEPFVQANQTTGAVTVSAYRINPTIPTDDFTSVALNDAVWHGTTDISGVRVDWSSNPIQYSLPVTTVSITVQRPAPIWNVGGTRAAGAIGILSLDRTYIGYRNTADLGWIGNAGYVMLVGITMAPLTQGLYSLTYQFRSHPWKHAVQVPWMVGSAYDRAVNASNPTRVQNEKIWWSQPHLQGVDFVNTLNLTPEEWEAVDIP